MKTELKNEIADMCEQAGCSDKIKKIHYDQYVNRKWNPHPPQKFVDWWLHDGVGFTEKKTNRGWLGVAPTIAFNCEAVRESYREYKAVGLSPD